MFEWRDGEFAKGMPYRKLLYLLCLHASKLNVLPYTARMERKDEIYRLDAYLALCKVQSSWRGIRGRRDAREYKQVVEAKRNEQKRAKKGVVFKKIMAKRIEDEKSKRASPADGIYRDTMNVSIATPAAGESRWAPPRSPHSASNGNGSRTPSRWGSTELV